MIPRRHTLSEYGPVAAVEVIAVRIGLRAISRVAEFPDSETALRGRVRRR
ncbi:hypothetical protein GCM10023085_72560 [Actinomadura viridis]|uniref:Uncharacterized protein n=1 Tax=Actinomadura viridis TaxID=58110 RepID=A0A931DSD8_9ACTN|nr:hypothetical protein [Actinomadura viridis]